MSFVVPTRLEEFVLKMDDGADIHARRHRHGLLASAVLHRDEAGDRALTDFLVERGVGDD